MSESATRAEAPELGGEGRRTAGVAWTVVARVLALASQFGLMMVASRYISPEDFGVYSLLTATAQLIAVPLRSGWMECAVTAADAPERAQVNLLALVAALTAVGLAGMAALVHASFSTNRTMLLVAGSLALSLLPTCLSAAQQGVLMLNGRVERMGQAQLASELVGLSVGVYLLTRGAGPLALALGKLTSEYLNGFSLVLSTRWFPVPRLDRSMCRRLARTWANFASANLMAMIGASGSTYLIGFFAGATETGLFRAGVRFSGVVSELLTEPSRVTYWGAMRCALDRGGQRELSEKSVSLSAATMLFGAPMAVGLAAVSNTVVATALSASWSGTGPVVALSALSVIPVIPAFMNGPLLTVAGYDRMVPRLTLWSTVISFACLALSAPHGAVYVALGGIISSCLYLMVSVLSWRAVAALSPRALFRRYLPALTAAFLMGGGVRALPRLLPALSPPWLLALQVTSGAMLYLLAIAVLAPRELTTLLQMSPFKRINSARSLRV